MLTRVVLHGVLGREFEKVHYFELETPSDLVRAMNSNYPEFKIRILEYERLGFGYRLVNGNDLSGRKDLSESRLIEPLTNPELHLIPVSQGSGGFFRIITGVVLIGAGFLLGGFGAGFFANALIGVGASLALGGVAQLLAPRPQTPSFESQEQNTIFGAGNGVSPFRYGIPLVYGRFRVRQPAILSSATKSIAPNTEVSNIDFSTIPEYQKTSFYKRLIELRSDGVITEPVVVDLNSKLFFEIRGTLQNETSYSAIGAISEGEIQGVANASVGQSIFIDNTALLNSEGAENFLGIKYVLTSGTTSQDIGQLFPNTVLSETLVGASLELNNPVVRTITGDFFQLWIKLQISQLFYLASDGDIDPIELFVLIECSTDGKPFVELAEIQYYAKTQVLFEQTIEVPLPISDSGSWDVRVTKIRGADSDREKTEVAWSSYTTHEAVNNDFPDVSILGIEVNAEFLGTIPELGAEIEGIKCFVPHNYNPVTRSYSGEFNGTLSGSRQYTNNPVWCLYDILTTSRYGVGLSASQIDIYSFYSASVYCDALVDDGDGGTEPRYTLNVSLVERVDAQEIVRAIASNFNAFPVWSNGKLGLAQDRPSNPVWAFTHANVLVETDDDGIESPPFQYSQIDVSSRYSACNVAFIDPENNWDVEVEAIDDSALTSTYGYKSNEVAGFGCTSRGMARRIGRWEIFTSNYNDRIVTFRAARDMLPIDIGEVIEIFDRDEQGIKLAGRIIEDSATSIIALDQSPDLEGVEHELTIYYFDGTKETRDVVSVDGNLITVEAEYTINPSKDNLFALRRTDIDPTLWRVISISEEDEEVFVVEAVKYSESKWAYVEDGSLLPSRQTSFLTATPQAPQNLQFSSSLILDQGTSRFVVKGFLEWDYPSDDRINGYELRYRRLNEYEWINRTIRGEQFDVLLEIDTYEFQLRTVSVGLFKSPWASITVEVNPASDIPADVTNFTIEPRQNNLAMLRWDASSDADVQSQGLIRIKFSASGNGWNSSQLIDEFSGNSRSGIVPLLDGTYYAKWVDPFGNVSENAASITASGLNLLENNIVATITENPSFSGTKTDCEVNGSGNLTISVNNFFDGQLGDFDDKAGLFDSAGDSAVATTATYLFANSLVVSDLQDVQLVADYSASFSGLTSDLFDSATGDFDDREGEFDGMAEQFATVQLEVRTSSDGVTFGSWTPFTVGIFNLLEAEFRAIFTSDGAENIEVSELQVIADVQDRTEAGTVTTSSSADTVVTFSRPYITAPIGISYTTQNGLTEDQVEITNVTKDGFTINVFFAMSRIARDIYWITESY